MGATYHTSASGLSRRFDVVVECTGALTEAAIWNAAPGGIACLIGGAARHLPPSISVARLSHELIMHNKAVIGTVNANKRHFESAHDVLTSTDTKWLNALLSTRVPLEDWRSALEADRADSKSLITFGVV